MSITTTRYRTSTGERVATFKLTINVSAEDIATALMNSTGACYDHDTEVVVTEEAIREALMGLFHDGMETAGYRIGDNGGDARLDEIKADVVDVVFEGREHHEVQS